jgi:hypothetical protein
VATEKPYTLGKLISTLAFLAIEGAFMVAGTTWLVLSHHDSVGVAYLNA